MISRRTARPSRFARAAWLAPAAALALVACSTPGPSANTSGERRLVAQQAGVAQSANSQVGASPTAKPNLCEGRQSPLPAPAGFVSDFAKVVDAGTKARLESQLAGLKKSARVEFAVVTVETTAGRDIFDYSLDVACGWGVGPGANQPGGGGVLLLVATKDRRWRVQVSRSLEAALPDEAAKRIGGRMAEHFKRGDFGAGVSSAVEEHIALLAPGAKAAAPKPTP